MKLDHRFTNSLHDEVSVSSRNENARSPKLITLNCFMRNLDGISNVRKC